MEPPASNNEHTGLPLAKPPRGSSTIKKLVSSIGMLLFAFLIAVGLLVFVFNLYQVDGPSMEDTLHDRDRVIVWKLPTTWAKLTGGQNIPSRGSIIVFSESGLSSSGRVGTEPLVKRVIGLPGEHVVVKDGKVSVYNTQHPDGFQPDETLGYQTLGTTSGYNDIRLTDNEIFVLGDNRSNSIDSRRFGPIHTDQIIGTKLFRIFSFN